MLNIECDFRARRERQKYCKIRIKLKKSTFILNILPALRYKELDNCLPIDHKKVESYLRE